MIDIPGLLQQDKEDNTYYLYFSSGDIVKATYKEKDTSTIEINDSIVYIEHNTPINYINSFERLITEVVRDNLQEYLNA